jgi:hypothetical protein
MLRFFVDRGPLWLSRRKEIPKSSLLHRRMNACSA